MQAVMWERHHPSEAKGGPLIHHDGIATYRRRTILGMDAEHVATGR